VTRLLRSLFVAARRFAPLFSRALDTPLGAVGSLLPAGVCYRALRRLPGQDLHLLEQRVFRTHHFIIVTKPGIACVVSQISNSPGPGGIWGRYSDGWSEQKESRIEEGHLMPTVGRDETVVREYIRKQEQEDQRLDQMGLW